MRLQLHLEAIVSSSRGATPPIPSSLVLLKLPTEMPDFSLPGFLSMIAKDSMVSPHQELKPHTIEEKEAAKEDTKEEREDTASHSFLQLLNDDLSDINACTAASLGEDKMVGAAAENPAMPLKLDVEYATASIYDDLIAQSSSDTYLSVDLNQVQPAPTQGNAYVPDPTRSGRSEHEEEDDTSPQPTEEEIYYRPGCWPIGVQEGLGLFHETIRMLDFPPVPDEKHSS